MVTDRVLIHPYSADFALRSSRTPWFRLRFSPETGADGLSAVRRSRVVQDLANDLFLAALGKFLLITLLWGDRMGRKTNAALLVPLATVDTKNPLDFVNMVGGRPDIHFYWKEEAGKKPRLIGNPNKPTRRLHEVFGHYIREGIIAMGDNENYPLRRLPSSTAFVKDSNPLKNAEKHAGGKFFYIADIWNAYPSVDLERLTVLIVYIRKYDEYKFDFSLSMLGQNYLFQHELTGDSLYPSVHAFLESYCGGIRGRGLAVGGPLSPYLFNLYCEAYVDASLRKLCDKYDIAFTRYADDFVFSRNKPIVGEIREDIRRCITRAGFHVNHRKSKVLSREMGTVFVTKMGLRNDPGKGTAILVFSQKKRRRLHGMIGSYLVGRTDWPQKVKGFISEFIYYYKNVVVPTATDRKTFGLCKKFEAEWAKYEYR